MNKVDLKIGKVNDLQIGEMKQIRVDNHQILLARLEEKKFYATAAHCTHSGAPLEKGILSEERVVCPWHNACFNITTGDQEQPPGLDALPSFPVHLEGENVIIELPEKVPMQRTHTMAKHNPNADSRVFAIIGTGAAGNMAAETLRREGFQGQIFLITKEEKLPYDRTKLSKKYLQGNASAEDLPQRSCEFYQEYDIELRCGRAVTQVDPKLKTITFEDQSKLSYNKLLVATGGKAIKLDVPGADLENIYTLHQFKDADQILGNIEQAKQAVIVGSSFIGMEVAASLAKQGIAVTVVSPDSVPFEKILGKEIGKMFQKLHENQGVSFKLGTKVTQFEGSDKVSAAITENGEKIPTDLVIVGIGVKPVTQFINGVEINNQDNSVVVNEYLQATDDVYAVGDIAQFPYQPTGKMTRIEHWRLAAQHGRIAAQNMLGKMIKFTEVPFFWSGQYDVKLRYAGHAEDWDEIIIDGELNQQNFLVFYIKDNQVLAVAGCGRDRDITAITELMRLQQMPTPDVVRQPLNWVQQLHH
jgi:NADPH-dependent 2,4-dienoyl-CoA reductase/sulfur reductase-like enzyme/nitrite reductase/ring-hydroxylating ferredoxin subunit